MSDSNEQRPSSPIRSSRQHCRFTCNGYFRKNGLNIEKKELPDEQREMLRKMIDDLTNQVNKFVQSSKNKVE